MPSPHGSPNRGPSTDILGPPPSQSYAIVKSPMLLPTLTRLLHIMILNLDQNWYLDTGATNHMSYVTGLTDSTRISHLAILQVYKSIHLCCFISRSLASSIRTFGIFFTLCFE